MQIDVKKIWMGVIHVIRIRYEGVKVQTVLRYMDSSLIWIVIVYFSPFLDW